MPYALICGEKTLLADFNIFLHIVMKDNQSEEFLQLSARRVTNFEYNVFRCHMLRVIRFELYWTRIGFVIRVS